MIPILLVKALEKFKKMKIKTKNTDTVMDFLRFDDVSLYFSRGKPVYSLGPDF